MILDYDKYDFIDAYRHNVFELPFETPFQYPTVGDIDQARKDRLKERYTIDGARTIVLAPRSHALGFLGDAFWENLARKLSERGFIVYTNVGGKEKPVAGTQPLAVSFEELFYLAGEINCVISHRSGLLDYLVFSKARILAISPCRWLLSLRSELKYMFPRTVSTVRT